MCTDIPVCKIEAKFKHLPVKSLYEPVLLCAGVAFLGGLNGKIKERVIKPVRPVLGNQEPSYRLRQKVNIKI